MQWAGFWIPAGVMVAACLVLTGMRRPVWVVGFSVALAGAHLVSARPGRPVHKLGAQRWTRSPTSFRNPLRSTNVLFVAAGIFLGYVVGAIPGLGKVTAAAIAIPLTYAMNPVSAIGFLVGIAKGSTAGNAVSAILINTPGEPSSVPTAMDGYPLARQGKGVKAMKVAIIASTVGDFCSTWLLIFLTAPLAAVAVQIGKVELASILIFALTFIAALSGKSLSKGLISGMIGIILASVGLEIETGTQRLTFGSLQVFDGLPLIAMAIGIVAVAEMVLQFEEQIVAAQGRRERSEEARSEDG